MKNARTLPLLRPAKLIGTWFGVGLAPRAPGTFGSIAALPFAWAIQSQWGSMGLFSAAVAAFIVGCIACQKYLPYVDALDPREMVIDEVHGQWLLLAFMPLSLPSYAVGLVLFRLFDILKPWPISVADRAIHGGFGVMFDDTLAALYPVVIAGCIIIIGNAAGYPAIWQNIQELLK